MILFQVEPTFQKKKNNNFNPQNRTVAGLKMKWKNDKSNIRDYVQYLKTSQSRSGRAPEEIPKPKFMNLMAEVIGADCPALGPVPGNFISYHIQSIKFEMFIFGSFQILMNFLWIYH